MHDPDRLPFGLIRVGVDGTLLAANRRAAEYVGTPPEALPGSHVDRLLSAGGRLLYHTYLMPLLQLHGHVHEFALPLVARTGATTEVLVYASFDRAAELPAIELALLPMQERRRIESELLRVRRAADSAPGMLFEYALRPDGRGRFAYASAGALELFGLTPEVLAEGDEALLALVHPEDGARLLAERGQSQAAESQWVGTYRTRRRGAPADAWTWLAVRATPRPQADGVVVWHGYVTDVTRQRENEQAAAARRSAEDANRAKSEFLARMSHELRTPLNGIIGFAHLLAADPQARFDDEQRRRLGIIESSGQRLLTLIDEVLDISRIEAGRIDLTLSDVALAPLLTQALQAVEPMARRAAVRLALRDPGVMCVRADASRLSQVMANLLSNAVKYNRPEGRVDVRVVESAGQARIEVADSGAGLDAAQVQQLFQPFNRLGAERSRTEGTGLGLVITRSLVELMGGRIGVDSTPGRGTTMSVSLPLATTSAAAEPFGASLQDVPVPERADGGRWQVLYVEDNPVNATLVEAVFEDRPHVALRVVGTAADAQRAVRDAAPDLLLLDMNLPDADGCTLLARLRADPALAAVPAVAVSADAMTDQIELARRAGFHAYWTKPLDVDRMVADVDRLLLASPIARA